MDADTAVVTESGLPRPRAVAFIILLGTISLFADMTYEGVRSITGPYLRMLASSSLRRRCRRPRCRSCTGWPTGAPGRWRSARASYALALLLDQPAGRYSQCPPTLIM
jgi:hypothetical protein